jgi:uncharacterized hydrophobic protein (TIGR00271 family)
MIEVQVFGESRTMARVAQLLDDLEGVSRVRLVTATSEGQALVTAAVAPRAVDGMLAELRGAGVPDTTVTLTRLELVGRAATGQVEAGLVWEDVLGMAWLYSRPIGRYLAFMVVAGVIACYGVIDDNAILIVGAMAVSPDLLPIVAAAVGIVGRRVLLAVHALATLTVGLAVSSLAAAVSAFAQDQTGAVPADFDVHTAGVLGGLLAVSHETITVAFVAGAAGMLALETRASSGVGVAISVTTIPASAFLGVAAGLGEVGEARGALGLLGANVAMLVAGATVTLAAQRLLMRRAVARRSGGGSGR